MIDNFKTDLVVRVAAISLAEVLKAMGYLKPTSANLERLQNVLESHEFGLNDGGYDFKFSSEGFLRALCVVLGMDMALTDQRITRVTKRLAEEKAAFHPCLWVDTGFTRKGQPLFALAACEHQRYLNFAKGFWRLPLDRQLGRAQCMVREHVFETGGTLGIWGEIKQYWFYYKKEAAYLLARNGEVIGNRAGPVPSQAKAIMALDVISPETREAPQ
ncbi:hypothetical protein SAMN05216369_2644 [Marinobacter antarcticus]|uniref:Uncharacterized protein n=1 Tax=Marinobacter antarcticus TaxID=564117 RepID=A0A1M6U7N8_9GAMM|nr:hypothetical protein [Marinobacter antarcticus]SHK65088.1 hypothetical protein SAMN05216369_2644 [Marinobacter antarcticus]